MGIHWLKEPLDEPAKTASQEKLDGIVSILKAGGCDVSATDDINSMRWNKNLW